MYNLMVTAGDDLWEEGAYTWRKERIFEGTSDPIKAKLCSLDQKALVKLMALPTLFLYEKGVSGTPRVGKVKSIKQRNSDVRITFEFDESNFTLTSEKLDQLKWDLEI